MKKAIKVILCIIGGLVALIVALVATLPLWLGPVVKPSANTMVPKFTKTGFHLGVLSLNPYTGRFELGDMQLKNPEGFSEADAATVGQIVVDVAMNTLSGEVVHIEEITIRDVFVSYVNAKGVNNFKQIQYNLAGGKEQYEAKQQAAATEQQAAANEPEPTASEEAQARDEAEAELKELNKKRVVIDRLTISGLKVKLGFIPIALPDIELTDIGKQSNGATWAEVWENIMAAVMKSIGAVGDGVKALSGALGDGAKALGGALGEGANSVGEGAGKAIDAAGEGAVKAIDAVGEGAGKAVNALKGLFN